MQLEITYSYKEDKYSLPQTSWTYYTPKSEDLKKAIAEADKYYKKFVSSSGWGKKASLISISTLKNETTPPDHRVITPEPTKRRSTRSKKKPKS